MSHLLHSFVLPSVNHSVMFETIKKTKTSITSATLKLGTMKRKIWTRKRKIWTKKRKIWTKKRKMGTKKLKITKNGLKTFCWTD